MHLTPRERDRLMLFLAAELARRRRSRGRRLGATESVALICDEMLEHAWDGAALDEVLAYGRSVLGREDVLDGVPEMVRHVEVEALFPNGTALLALDDPFGHVEPDEGPVATGSESIELNPGRPRIEIEVRNEGAVPVYVSSHYHFAEVTPALHFDRERAGGMRLDIPAGTSLGWRPGERRLVRLVPFAGERVVWGFSGAVQGPVGPVGPVGASGPGGTNGPVGPASPGDPERPG